MDLLRSFLKAFPLAFSGILQVVKKEKNIKFHLFAAFSTIILGLVLGITKTEWLAIILIIAVVLAAETFNSAIEEVCNLLKKENHLDYQKTKLIRDISAGAVLLLAITSVIIGAIIFLPYLL